MVPFYGQGMNCAFEDCLVLDSFLYGRRLDFGLTLTDPHVQSLVAERNPSDWVKSLEAFSRFRHPDVTAMCDLAMYNHVEMRSNVLNFSYRLRKLIEGALHSIFPRTVIPLYTMVSFSRIPYSVVIRRWQRQTRWLYAGSGIVLGAVLGAISWALLRKPQAIALSQETGAIAVKLARKAGETGETFWHSARVIADKAWKRALEWKF